MCHKTQCNVACNRASPFIKPKCRQTLSPCENTRANKHECNQTCGQAMLPQNTAATYNVINHCCPELQMQPGTGTTTKHCKQHGRMQSNSETSRAHEKTWVPWAAKSTKHADKQFRKKDASACRRVTTHCPPKTQMPHNTNPMQKHCCQQTRTLSSTE